MNTPVLTDRYKHHRFPSEIISHAVWLYFRFCLSYRDVEEPLFARGIVVPYEAIRKWCRKFGQAYANQLRRRRPRPGDTWHLEMCQTQPVTLSWRPLRLWEQTLRALRGGCTREHAMDVHVFSRDDGFLEQALCDGLPFCTRELVKMVPQSLAKGYRMLDHPWPMDTLLPRVRPWRTCLRELWPRGRELLTPRLERTQGHTPGLIGIARASGLPLEPPLPLQPLRLRRFQPGAVLSLGYRPGRMPGREQARRLQHRDQCVPDDRLASLRTDERGRTPRGAADRQRSVS